MHKQNLVNWESKYKWDINALTILWTLKYFPVICCCCRFYIKKTIDIAKSVDDESRQIWSLQTIEYVLWRYTKLKRKPYNNGSAVKHMVWCQFCLWTISAEGAGSWVVVCRYFHIFLLFNFLIWIKEG